MDMGAVIGAGFRIIRERPSVFAIWAAIYVAMSVAMGLLMQPYMEEIAAVEDGGANVGAMFSQMSSIFLFYPIMILVLLVLNNAAFRSVLRPNDDRAAYLRLGMDEVRVVVLGVIFFTGFSMITLMFPLIAAIGSGFGFSRGGDSPGAGMVVLLFAIVLISLLAWVVLAVRLSLAFPLTVMRRKIIIGDAWRLSRGHFWALLGSFIVVFLIYLIAAGLVGLIGGGGMMTMFNPERLQQMSQRQMSDGLSVLMIVSWLVSGIIGAFWVALSAGGLATAAQQLAPDSEEELEAVWA